MDLHDKGPVCACAPVYNENTLHSLLTGTGTENRFGFNYFVPFDSAMLESPVQQNHSCSSSDELVNQHANTLQSLLRGEIPAQYSHLAVKKTSPPPPSPCNSPSHQIIFSSSRFTPLSSEGINSPSPDHIPLPSPVTFSDEHYKQEEDAYGSASSSPCSPLMFSQEQPIDLSCKSDQDPHSPGSRSPTLSECSSVDNEDRTDTNSGSLLRELLCIGKQLQGYEEEEPLESRASRDQDENHFLITSSTRVTLAKKTMFPVSSRVSDWLVKLVQFARSIPEFVSLSQNDKMTLILNSWTRLLLLFMAENNFQFVVTPLCYREESERRRAMSPTPDEPTMKSVDSVQTFIRKCQNMSLGQKEYAFLRMAVLFNAGYVGLERPEVVDQLNSLVQQLLQQHVAATRPDDVMHYSRLLLCLPALYGINCKMVENLFCKHINGKMDMEVLLKEMLQNL